jgi:hypothetical protein
MCIRRIEALAVAIAREHNAMDVSSEAFETLNPGLLRSHTLRTYLAKRSGVNENGVRVFESYRAGHSALVDNLRMKCEGKTQSTGKDGILGPESTLQELCSTFQYVKPRTVVEFLKDALNDGAISERTPIGFFLEGQGDN